MRACLSQLSPDPTRTRVHKDCWNCVEFVANLHVKSNTKITYTSERIIQANILCFEADVGKLSDTARIKECFPYINLAEKSLRPCRCQIFSQILLCKKKILHHIKMSAHAWSTTCRWNQKLIAQFSCTLRYESFESN
jgi:hypothetical protein